MIFRLVHYHLRLNQDFRAPEMAAVAPRYETVVGIRAHSKLQVNCPAWVLA